MDDDLSAGGILLQHLEGMSQAGQLVEDAAQGPEVRPGGGQWTPALLRPALVVVGLVLADLRAEVVGRPCTLSQPRREEGRTYAGAGVVHGAVQHPGDPEVPQLQSPGLGRESLARRVGG